MARQISNAEHEIFLTEIRSLNLDNKGIGERMGKGETIISRYRGGGYWPSRTTLNIFNNVFKDDLRTAREEARKRNEVPDGPYSPGETESKVQGLPEDYRTNPIPAIMHHIGVIENSLSMIKKVVETITEKPDEEAIKEKPSTDKGGQPT